MNTIFKKKRVESSQTVIGTKDIYSIGVAEKNGGKPPHC